MSSSAFRMDSASTQSAQHMVDIRQARVGGEWWGEHTHQLVDLHKTTMIFMGKEGLSTAAHADWADAQNIVFATAHAKKVCLMNILSHADEVVRCSDCMHTFLQGKDTPLAKWVFFHPACLEEATAWMKVNVDAAGFQTQRQGKKLYKPFLDHDQILKLQAALGECPETGEAYERVVYQFHGQRIFVPAGWLHQVQNLADCVKLAWDFFGSPERLAVYLAAWQHVHFTVVKTNAADYMPATAVLCQAISKLQ